MRVRSGSSSSVHSSGGIDGTNGTNGTEDTGKTNDLTSEFMHYLKGLGKNILGIAKCCVKGIIQLCVYIVAAAVSEYETTQTSNNGPCVHKHKSTTTHTETGKN